MAAVEELGVSSNLVVNRRQLLYWYFFVQFRKYVKPFSWSSVARGRQGKWFPLEAYSKLGSEACHIRTNRILYTRYANICELVRGKTGNCGMNGDLHG